MNQAPERDATIGAVIEAVILISRMLTAAERMPSADIQVSPTQIEALFFIAHSEPDTLTPGQLATRLAITRGAVTQLVDGLIRVGLVRQEPHPRDARSRLLVLADEGAATVRHFEDDMIATMRPVFAALDDHELATLARLITQAATTKGAQ